MIFLINYWCVIVVIGHLLILMLEGVCQVLFSLAVKINTLFHTDPLVAVSIHDPHRLGQGHRVSGINWENRVGRSLALGNIV